MAAKRKKTAKAKRPKARKATKQKRHRKGTKREVGLTQELHYTLSPQLQEIVGSKKLPVLKLLRNLWVYIKCYKIAKRNTKHRRMINPDKKLGEVLGKPIDMIRWLALSASISKKHELVLIALLKALAGISPGLFSLLKNFGGNRSELGALRLFRGTYGRRSFGF